MARSLKSLKFEEAMKQLDAIVAAMEAGEIGLEESIDKYEEAMQLAARCQQILDQAEQRIQKIQRDADGKPVAMPLEAEEGPCEEPPEEGTGA